MERVLLIYVPMHDSQYSFYPQKTVKTSLLSRYRRYLFLISVFTYRTGRLVPVPYRFFFRSRIPVHSKNIRYLPVVFNGIDFWLINYLCFIGRLFFQSFLVLLMLDNFSYRCSIYWPYHQSMFLHASSLYTTAQQRRTDYESTHESAAEVSTRKLYHHKGTVIIISKLIMTIKGSVPFKCLIR